MTIALTDEQRRAARYALGLPNKQRRSYRKHYVTGEGAEAALDPGETLDPEDFPE